MENEKQETSQVGYGLGEAVRAFDLFPDKVKLIVENESSKYKTRTGGYLTLIMVLLIFVFGLVRFITMCNGDRTTLTDFVEHDAFGQDYTFDSTGTDFNIAFGIADYPISSQLNLTAFGDFFATYTTYTQGKVI